MEAATHLWKGGKIGIKWHFLTLIVRQPPVRGALVGSASDNTIVRVGQHAAGAGKNGIRRWDMLVEGERSASSLLRDLDRLARSPLTGGGATTSRWAPH